MFIIFKTLRLQIFQFGSKTLGFTYIKLRYKYVHISCVCARPCQCVHLPDINMCVCVYCVSSELFSSATANG